MMSDIRILRATRKIVEGDVAGEENFYEDFEIPAFLLTVSEVLGVMADDGDGVLVSEDSVIPLDDSIEDVRQLVGWMTREKGFKIHAGNMKGLARLSDKYMIDHLHHDLCTFTSSLIINKQPPTVELWEFAARYALPELESYCLENKSVYEDLLKVLGNEEQGIDHFARMGIPIQKLNCLVRRVATAALQKSCFFCLATPKTATDASPPSSPISPTTSSPRIFPTTSTPNFIPTTSAPNFIPTMSTPRNIPTMTTPRNTPTMSTPRVIPTVTTRGSVSQM